MKVPLATEASPPSPILSSPLEMFGPPLKPGPLTLVSPEPKFKGFRCRGALGV